MKFNTETMQLEETGSLGRIALIAGVLGLVLSAVGLTMDRAAFFQAYLIAFTYFTTIALGGLFFVLIHFLTGAVWSVVVRRIAENLASLLPVMALFSLPLYFGIHDLFDWSHAEHVAHDEILSRKAPFLNAPFFIIRNVFYFGVWTVLVVLLNRFSRQLDGGDADALRKLRKTAGFGIVLFAFTVTFFGFDWLMSLDAHWFSTIFGVYVFSGGFLAALAFMTLVILYLRSQDVARGLITVEHLHDYGKLMFAFTVWWAYIGGSQYFLIWYANIPEETAWFLGRWHHGWKPLSIALMGFHFGLPFLLLIFQASKRTLAVLATTAVVLVIMHYIDHYWLVMPTHSFGEHGGHLSWIHFTAIAGIGGIFAWYLCRRMSAGPLLPVGDPKLQNSIHHTN